MSVNIMSTLTLFDNGVMHWSLYVSCIVGKQIVRYDNLFNIPIDSIAIICVSSLN